jgi:hypothetical protein
MMMLRVIGLGHGLSDRRRGLGRGYDRQMHDAHDPEQHRKQRAGQSASGPEPVHISH